MEVELCQRAQPAQIGAKADGEEVWGVDGLTRVVH